MINELLSKYKRPFTILYISLFCFSILGAYALLRDNSEEIGKTKLNSLVTSRTIERAVASNGYIYIYTPKAAYSVQDTPDNRETVLRVVFVEHGFDNATFFIAITLLMAAFIFVWKSVYERRVHMHEQRGDEHKQQSETSSSYAQVVAEKTTVTFEDVAGVDEAKNELIEVVEFLKNPAKFQKLRISIPKGVLLVGPPGVGKTLLAKAVAHEAGVPFFYKSAATFVELYVGVGAKRVSELFAAAKAKAPAIIFIDEIDAIGKSRASSGSSEREATLNQILVEMDGFEEASDVIVIAATNQVDILDGALLRAGRFDRRVYVELPTLQGRFDIISRYLKTKPNSVDIHSLALKTSGFSGAVLANFVNEAAINAFKRGSEIIENADFFAVQNKVMYGKKRAALLGNKEIMILSLYQAAKLWFALKNSLHVVYASQAEVRIDEGDLSFQNGEEIEDIIAFYLSGRAATRALLDGVFMQSSVDYEHAHRLAEETLFRFALYGKQEFKEAKEYLWELELSLAQEMVDDRKEIEKIAEEFTIKNNLGVEDIEQLRLF